MDGEFLEICKDHSLFAASSSSPFADLHGQAGEATHDRLHNSASTIDTNGSAALAYSKLQRDLSFIVYKNIIYMYISYICHIYLSYNIYNMCLYVYIAVC